MYVDLHVYGIYLEDWAFLFGFPYHFVMEGSRESFGSCLYLYICVSGCLCTYAYSTWNTDNLENESIKNGWFHTNDLGWMDGEGYLYLTGRKSDMIISGGFNIYPNEVESIILQLKEISEVVVIGIPNEIWGEIVTAFVVFNKGMKLTQSQILDFLSKEISSYKKPKNIHTVKNLPRNNNRKIDRNFLKKNWRDLIIK